jgi:hypothetical protein
VGALRAVNRQRPPGVIIEFDAFSVAVGLAVITGALSFVAPFLEALTVALAALAVAGWAALQSAERVGLARGLPATRLLGLALAGGGAAAFFVLPGPIAMARGLVLGASLVPLWLVERRRATPGPDRSRGPG